LPGDIRLAAMDLLARREHSVQELRAKLKRRFADESMIDEQLARLARDNLQSDARFAGSYVRQRVGRGYGPLRLRAELRERGVSDADSDMALEAAAVDWCELASTVLRKKFGDGEPGDMKDKARRIRFIQHRGFASDHYRGLLWE
jgi:regulatory protein